MSVKLSEIRVGDVLIADNAFTCLVDGCECVVRGGGRDLYVKCIDGKHYLDGQIGEDGETLIGFTIKAKAEVL